MPGLTPNPDESAVKPWTVWEFYDDNGLTGSDLIGVFYATTAEEATALACEDEPLLTLCDPDSLTAQLAWLVPMTPWEKTEAHPQHTRSALLKGGEGRGGRRRQDRVVKLAGVLLCLAVVACVGCGEVDGATEGSHQTTAHAIVAYAVDGDTLRVRLPSGDLAYVRLVGMLSRVSRPTLRLPAAVTG
jgi:hypothetical protein